MSDERREIFDAVRPLMARYAPPLTVTSDFDARYELTSVADVEIAGRRKDSVYFGGLIIQSSYVGLYFMPVYADAALADVFDPALLKLLKGKSCFHLRRLDDELLGHVDDALERGFELYRERGWLPA
jgi:hypothetical protein